MSLSPLLRPYQRDGVAFLTGTPNALLADDMGAGKTVMVAQALGQLREARLLRRALVAAPAALLPNWERELRRWGPDVAVRTTSGLSRSERAALWALPVPIVVASYEAVRADFLPTPPRSLLWDAAVFDEAQRLKNRDAESAMAVRRVPSLRRWALSATPLENGVEDLSSLAEVIRLTDGPLPPLAPALLEAFQGHFLRRRKREVAPEMPHVIDQELPLRLSGTQAEQYESLAATVDEAASTSELLTLITRLKQLCNHASDGTSVKFDALRLLLEDPGLGEAKVVVISQYTRTLDWLAMRLPVPVLRYAGDMRTADREDALRRFREAQGPLVLLLSLRAGGVGLNLPEASHVVMYDRWWNRAVEDQAVARADRLGREGVLLVHRYVVEGTVEDRILELSTQRAELFEDLIEGQLSDRRLSKAALLSALRPGVRD